MDQILFSLRGLADRAAAAGRLRATLLSLALTGVGAAVVLAVLSAVAGWSLATGWGAALAGVVGAGAGAGLFTAGYGWWWAGMGEPWRTRCDLKDRMPLPRRRMLAATVLIVWLGLMLALQAALGGFAPPVALTVGPLTVVLLLALWLTASTTPAERELLEAALEAMDAADAAAAERAAQAALSGDAPAVPAKGLRARLARLRGQ